MHHSSPSSHFSLNSRQKEAIQATHGPLLICAGAGSGKTQVLTSRIAYILEKNLASCDQILAVTFTNKAAKEMSERVFNQIADTPIFEPLWISTFHSTCSRILRENISKLNPRTRVIIYDTSDQLSLIKKIMKESNIDDQYHTPKSFLQQISLCKRMALSPQHVNDQSHFRVTDDFPQLYERYEQQLIEASAFDFEGLIFEVHKLFNQHKEVLQHYQDKFQFISIDEYQDTNHIQYLLVKQLAQKHKNICVVGDEDQSIYSWRGADISNILNFEKDFPNCKVIKLEQNYRSTNVIVSAAASLIKNNYSRINKSLFTENNSGDLIKVKAQWNDIDEARYVARTIQALCATGDCAFSDFSVFYRTNSQSRVFEDQFRLQSIPYQIIGNLKFYDRAEVKDMISYLRLILNQNDEMALRRVINSPRRGIGKTTIDKANALKLSSGQSLYDSFVQLAECRQVTNKTARAIFNFKEIIDHLSEESKREKLSNLYLSVLEHTKYIDHLKADNSIEARNRIDNVNEISNAIVQFEKERGSKESSLEFFLEQMSLVSSHSDAYDKNSVSLMTLHLSKGLEFDVVFITGLEEGLFPLIQSAEDMDVEEERRLAYVGITRARQKLFLSYAKSRNRFGIEKKQIPSRFLKEISNHYLENAL